MNPRDPIALLRERLAQAHREAAAALDAGDDEGYETAVAVGEIYRMRLAAVRGHQVSLLPSKPGDSTVTGTEMQASKDLTGEEQRRLGIAKARSGKHPFQKALTARGSYVSKWAREHGLDRNEVKSWFSNGAPRPIPRKWADEIERTLGVPATKRNWPRGIKD